MRHERFRVLQHVVDQLHAGCEPLLRLLDHLEGQLGNLGRSTSVQVRVDHEDVADDLVADDLRGALGSTALEKAGTCVQVDQVEEGWPTNSLTILGLVALSLCLHYDVLLRTDGREAYRVDTGVCALDLEWNRLDWLVLLIRRHAD